MVCVPAGPQWLGCIVYEYSTVERCIDVRLGFVGLPDVGYLRGMKLTRTNLWLAAATAMLLTASCAQAPNAAEAEQDPSADAAYKRAHRAEGYREAQRSNVTRN
jgi:hypothetical protein